MVPPPPPYEVLTGAVVRSFERSRDLLKLFRGGTCKDSDVSM